MEREEGKFPVEEVEAETAPAPDFDGKEGEESEAVSAEKDLLRSYLREVGRYSLLSPEEELRLLRQVRQGQRRIHSVLRKLPKEIWGQVQIRRRGSFHKATLLREREVELVRWIRTHPVKGVPRAQLRELLREIAAGEAEFHQARERLILANLRLVLSIANRYRGLGLPYLDLIQEGNQGLMRAVERFDPSRGFRLSTYATSWIRQGIVRAISDKARVVRLPIHIGERYYRLIRLANTLSQIKGARATMEEVASAASTTPQKVDELFGAGRDIVSLQAPVGDEGTELGGFIPDIRLPGPADHVEEKQTKRELGKVLHTLAPREETVIRLRFGIGESRNHSLEEIGKRLSVTRERVRQIEREALRKLRSGPARQKLKMLVAETT